MQKYLLESVKNDEKISGNGNPYIATGIKIAGVWYNGLGNKETLLWQAGDKVSVKLYQEEYGGNMQNKFKYISKYTELEQRIERLERVVTALYRDTEALKSNMLNAASVNKPYKSPSGREVTAHGVEDSCDLVGCVIHSHNPPTS